MISSYGQRFNYGMVIHVEHPSRNWRELVISIFGSPTDAGLGYAACVS
ncbi:UNVERIFIED_ORG: hypothetical protein GGE44_000794 [Rhizobium esperanzae]